MPKMTATYDNLYEGTAADRPRRERGPSEAEVAQDKDDNARFLAAVRRQNAGADGPRPRPRTAGAVTTFGNMVGGYNIDYRTRRAG